jgi:two-component system, sporulation sensor kinase E
MIFLIVAAIISICILSALIYVALRYIVIKPLKEIENSTKKIREGLYDTSLDLNKKDEIGSLANAFEEMRKKIKQTTEQLTSDEEKYRGMINHSIEAVAVVDDTGKIFEFNNKLINLSGYDKKKLAGINLYNMIDLNSTKYIIDEKKEKILEEHFESKMATNYGLTIPVEIYKIKGFTLNNNPNYSLIYIRDLSERKKIEQYSIQTEKMFALGQISAGIAHEIRNPLFAINNNLNFLKKRFNESKEFNDIYPEFKGGLDRIEKIVSAILDYARPHELAFENIQIKKIIEKSLMLVQKQFEKSAIKIRTEYNHNSKLIEADPHQLEQVFMNLLLNSFQAMSGAGKLIIKTKSEKFYLNVEIEDSGIGIPKEEIDRVFDPFYSKFTNGTGLGMAIVRRILDQHKAQFSIKSEEGIGTVFYISFPYSQG